MSVYYLIFNQKNFIGLCSVVVEIENLKYKLIPMVNLTLYIK